MQYNLASYSGKTIGIFSGPIIDTAVIRYTLLTSKQDGLFQSLSTNEISEEEYGTHEAFGTFPILEVVRIVLNEILLRLPNE
jgi:hypothetical protein